MENQAHPKEKRPERVKTYLWKFWDWFDSQGVANLLTIAAFTYALNSYVGTKRLERMQRDAEMRVALISDAQMADMMRRIGHLDRELKKILYKIIDAPDRYDPDLLTVEEENLRQQLDSYLNSLEVTASLWHRDWLEEEDFRGFWGYYIKELTRWYPLWAYVTTKDFEWEDIVWTMRELEKQQ